MTRSGSNAAVAGHSQMEADDDVLRGGALRALPAPAVAD
jgi:hypothetical protein